MTSAEGHYDSMYGRIESAWRVDGVTVTYRIMVPANTTATLMLPTSNPTSVNEGGKPATSVPGVTWLRSEHGRAVYRVASGSYVFTAPR